MKCVYLSERICLSERILLLHLPSCSIYLRVDNIYIYIYSKVFRVLNLSLFFSGIIIGGSLNSLLLCQPPKS